MTGRPTIQGWDRVPADLWTKTQLATADLPRLPGGPVRAWVRTTNWRGRPQTVPLYAVSESLPTGASAAQLDAAAARRDPALRQCVDCGARPERPLVAMPDGTRRCATCRHLAGLRAELDRVAQARADASRWAAALLADTTTALVHVEAILRPPARSGRRNPRPVALRIDALDVTGAELLAATVRTAGPRARAMPGDAIAPESVAERLHLLLTTRRVVAWTSDSLRPLWTHVLGGLPRGWYAAGIATSVIGRAAHWRGDLDPHTGVLHTPTPPGRADRLLVLLRRMAAQP